MEGVNGTRGGWQIDVWQKNGYDFVGLCSRLLSSPTLVIETSRPKGVAESRLGSSNEFNPYKVQDAAPPYRQGFGVATPPQTMETRVTRSGDW